MAVRNVQEVRKRKLNDLLELTRFCFSKAESIQQTKKPRLSRSRRVVFVNQQRSQSLVFQLQPLVLVCQNLILRFKFRLISQMLVCKFSLDSPPTAMMCDHCCPLTMSFQRFQNRCNKTEIVARSSSWSSQNVNGCGSLNHSEKIVFSNDQ